MAQPSDSSASLRQTIRRVYLEDESSCVRALLERLCLTAEQRSAIVDHAQRLVAGVRARAPESGGLDAFMHEYDLSSEEGVILMCLAEALLRIPDAATADRLIQDKLAEADWQRHLGHSASVFVNASTWGLMLTGKLMRLELDVSQGVGAVFGQLLARSSEPVIRLALKQAMRILGHQFVMGEDIDGALRRGAGVATRFSYDMLGEAALTREDADRYFRAYDHALECVGRHCGGGQDLYQNPGLSIKLSALHPRFEVFQRERVLEELVPSVRQLALKAREYRVMLTIDAEESERLEPMLDVFDAVYSDPALDGWPGLGLAVQAYQRRAVQVLDWLADRAGRVGRGIPVRLVKGAYWDTEIKRGQERGLESYPVFTRKAATDLSYLACAERIFAAGPCFFPQFATHNAHTVAAVMTMAGARDFEFQRLHGMGEELYRHLDESGQTRPCRVYAPVGRHQDLLPYLVRRLLENGANTSFVNRIVDESLPVASVVSDPVGDLEALDRIEHPEIPAPALLYGAQRINSRGLNLWDPSVQARLDQEIQGALAGPWHAAPLVDGAVYAGPQRELRNPAKRDAVIGTVVEAGEDAIEAALSTASEAFAAWQATPADARARLLESAADLFEARRAELIALAVCEGGRTIPDALAEVRETVDYCRYYAVEARRLFAGVELMAGPTGERNELTLHGRGVFACISPWNFPLAIFCGQITAALAAGNTVIAKPATQTPLCAMRIVQLLHEAGIPRKVLHLLPGAGEQVGMRLVDDPRVAGVVFTGSTRVAGIIQTHLARRDGPLVPLIAETGGQNCMIVDSSALPEQVVTDVLQSAFNSAGQRCSALRVLYLQDEIAPRVLALIQGAMAELRVGDPLRISTDIGPVIDEAARRKLSLHEAWLAREAQPVYRMSIAAELEGGCFFPPQVHEIESVRQLNEEVFGPILHVVRFSREALPRVVDDINACGYGLTLGVHSRIDDTARFIREHARVGNLYVNRNMIGAVVGVQPFGGEGLSGTGPKAGGPHYLPRFATERCYTVNTAAVGGNSGLLSLR